MRFLFVMVLCLGVGGVGQRAKATVLRGLTLEELADGADAIVIGRVLRSGVQLQARSGEMHPYSITTLEVRHWIKGLSTKKRIELREFGGVHPLVGERIDGVPEYRSGEEVLLFLEKHESTYRTFAMAQGKFRVVHGVGTPSRVARDLENVSLMEFEENGASTASSVRRRMVSHASSLTMQLDEMLRFLREREALRNSSVPNLDTPRSLR